MLTFFSVGIFFVYIYKSPPGKEFIRYEYKPYPITDLRITPGLKFIRYEYIKTYLIKNQ